MAIFRLLIVLILSSAGIDQAFSQAYAQPGNAIQQIHGVKWLSNQEAALGRPVLLRGVVIGSETKTFVMHDGKEGLFILSQSGAIPAIGSEVVVEGITAAGEFAPVVNASSVRTVGIGSVTPKRIERIDDLEAGSLDCQWVEVEGLLRSATPQTPAEPCYSAYAILASGKSRIDVSFLATSYDEVKGWIGSRVKLRATCGHYFNAHGQVFGARLVVPRSSEIDVLESGLPRSALPLSPIASLLRYTPNEPVQGLVRVRGTVTYQKGTTELYVRDEERGVRVRKIDQNVWHVGDVVDVAGFVVRGAFAPEIEDAETEKVGVGTPHPPKPMTASEAKVSDSELVQVDGILLDYFRGSEFTELTLKSEGAPFKASLPSGPGSPNLPAVGSLLRLTGVVQTLEKPAIGSPYPWIPNSFELRLRTPADLQVLQRPPSNPAVWAFGIATALVSIALLIAGRLWWNSQARLREQKRRRIEREAEFAAMMKERMRLSREIHDSLAQGFTAVSIQLEMAKHKLPPDAAVCIEHIETARSLVRESLTEARRSIQGLRSEALLHGNFADALAQSTARMLKDTSIAFHSDIEGDLEPLSPDAKNELLKIATEAVTNTVKHAQATNIHVTWRIRNGCGELRVSDDGQGFDPVAKPTAGFGLRGMQERAQRIKGQLTVSSDPGQGTHIVVTLSNDSLACKHPSDS